MLIIHSPVSIWLYVEDPAFEKGRAQVRGNSIVCPIHSGLIIM
jgi:hypothetical protein